MSDVWVVIAAFNEGKEVASAVGQARTIFPQVVVVDDGSTDNTGEEALAAGAHVCRHIVNLGQGASLATGIHYALEHGADAIITFDADGQHRVEDAAQMLALMNTTGVDVVMGSRFLGQSPGLSPAKRVFLKAAVLFTRVTTRLNVTDTHNGLRVLNRRAAETIRIRQNRMAHGSEILHQIHLHRLRFVEAPNTITYSAYSIAKGQRMTGAFAIVADLLIGRLHR